MKNVHVMGIGGSGASAVAAIAKAQGFKISGCDKIIDNEFTGAFSKSDLFIDHSPDHLENIDILVYTPAIFSLDPENNEIRTARERGLEVLTWQEFMGKYLEKDKFVIAVSGTHGKSTTTAMVAKILIESGLDPTVELGAIVSEWGTNYRSGHSKYFTAEQEDYAGIFITEADEFNDNFLVSHPDISVVTTIEMDHPEYFADFESYKTSFIKFLAQTKQLIIANLNDPNVAEVIKVVMKQSKATCLDYSKNDLGLKLQIPGKYNLLNASAAFQVGLVLGIEPEKIKKSLESYIGIGRRQELLGEVNGTLVYSDFGHHPTEIKVTLEALKEKHPDKKLWVVFQPHMFSRTKALFKEFVSVIGNLPVEGMAIMDIYPSREVDTGLVSSKELVEAIDKSNVEYVEDFAKYTKEFPKYLTENDVLIFMGAGTIDELAREFVKEPKSA